MTEDSPELAASRSVSESLSPKVTVMVYEYRQDDPRKCTSARIRKFGLARSLSSINQIPSRSIVLNPASSKTLSAEDREHIHRHGLVGLDCSWNLSNGVFDRNIPGENRRLPTLLAGNPTNYAIAGRLSTAEALAAALILTGFQKQGGKILSLFKWGTTFLTLNLEPLEEYRKAQPSDLSTIEKEYFPTKTQLNV